MTGILYLAAYLVAGIVISDALLKHRSGLIRLWVGMVAGLIMLMWFPSLIAFITGFTMTAQLAALGFAALLAVTAAICCRRRKRSSAFFGDMPAKTMLLLLIPLVALTIYLQYTHTLRDVNGALHVGQSTYGDLAMHISMATGLVDSPFPPEYTMLVGTRLGYPFLVDAMCASMYMTGAGLAQSFVITGSLMMSLVYLGFIIFAWELTHSRAALTIAYILMFINGGFGFIYVLDGVWKDSSRFINVFTGFYGAPTNMVDYNVRWSNVICDMMIPQRTLMAGWCVLLPAMYMLARAMKERSRRLFIILGVWAGFMPMIHTHSFLALGLLSAGAGLYMLIKRSDERRRTLIDLAFYALATLILALPQLILWTFPQSTGDGFLTFRFNWVNSQEYTGRLIDGYFWFWIKNVGLAYILVIPAALSASRRNKAFALGALVIYVVAELIQIQPNVYDNNKLFYVAYMAVLPMVGAFVVRIWNRLRGLRGRWLLACAFILVCTLSGGLTIAREVISDYELFTKAEVSAADFAREHTDREDVFLTADQHKNAVNVLAGKRIVCGSSSYLYYHGLDYDTQLIDAKQMLRFPESSRALFEKYGVDYVYISPYELGYDWYADAAYFADNCELVYENDGVRIYKYALE